jgi:small subunit ribosomal protein S19
MSRSSWKGSFLGIINPFLKVPQTLISERNKNTEKRKLDVVTYSRALVIIKDWVGLNIGVHNGKSFIPVFIIPPMIGHKLGEFSRTRIKPIHPKKNDLKGGNKNINKKK